LHIQEPPAVSLCEWNQKSMVPDLKMVQMA